MAPPLNQAVSALEAESETVHLGDIQLQAILHGECRHTAANTCCSHFHMQPEALQARVWGMQGTKCP